jgi:hypothetical protein
MDKRSIEIPVQTRIKCVGRLLVKCSERITSYLSYESSDTLSTDFTYSFIKLALVVMDVKNVFFQDIVKNVFFRFFRFKR